MPWNKVLPKFKAGELHSGSKKGPLVKSRSQAIAIMLHEKGGSKPEYKADQPLKGLKNAKPKTAT